MAATHLRVYHGPECDSRSQHDSQPADQVHSITLPANEIIPLLADAYASRRTWLRDFADDEITISADLYEVLAAYQFFRRPSA